jgi:hypothetical protein
VTANEADMKTTRTATTTPVPEAQIFTDLRQQRLLHAFGAITRAEQMQVIRFAETLALARSRRVAWQAAKRGVR